MSSSWNKNNTLRESEGKEDFVDYCKNYIVENLPDYEGDTSYGADLAGYLMEGPNADGSLTYSTQEAIDYIRDWWYDCADYCNYCKFSLGEVPNVFENPEAFMVGMVSEGIMVILGDSKFLQEHWNDDIELTNEVIETIISDVNDFEPRGDGSIF